MGLTAKDLVQAIGRPNRVYEVLNNKRALTLPMIRNLHEMFNIPLASLVGAAVVWGACKDGTQIVTCLRTKESAGKSFGKNGEMWRIPWHGE